MSRYYPIQAEQFYTAIEPLIISYKHPAGRPATISNYKAFNGIFYILRTGIPWRDLPEVFGKWHTVYTRFKRWSDNGLLWHIIKTLHKNKCAVFDMAWIDSTAIKLHRHGAGAPKKTENNQ
jgi:transposase